MNLDQAISKGALPESNFATNTTLRYQAPVNRLHPKVGEEQADFGDAPEVMGFFAPKTASVSPRKRPPPVLKKRLQLELDIKTGKRENIFMKTTIDLPDPLFRRAKATAAAKGQSLKTFISDSVEQSLNQEKQDWRAVLDNLPRVDDETTRQIMRTVDEWDDADLGFQRQQAQAEK